MPIPKPSRDLNQHLVPGGQSRDALDALKAPWMLPLRTPKATEEFGRTLGHHLCGGEIITLQGELGAGKTLLVKGIATGMGVSPDEVTSPTFTLIHEYSGPPRLVHADLYRIKSPDDLRSIGLEEYFESSTVVVIEWADRLGSHFSQDYLNIHLSHTQRQSRLASLIAHGPLSHALLQRVKNEMGTSLHSRTQK